jgi:hypothetical protein
MALSTALAVSPTPDWMGRKEESGRAAVRREKIRHVFANARRGLGCGAKDPTSSGWLVSTMPTIFFGSTLMTVRRADAVVGRKDGHRFAMGGSSGS